RIRLASFWLLRVGARKCEGQGQQTEGQVPQHGHRFTRPASLWEVLSNRCQRDPRTNAF
ncbi:MAG: hypothetical protein ACI8UD_003786, partial [Planctomycetota bacterium]